MPPKQVEESNSSYKAMNVLPLVLDAPNAEECVRKAVNIKKNIDKAKIIEILKDKGLQPHLNQNQISPQGRVFICQNFRTVCEQFMASVNKPVDSKKDAKKGGKESKKQEPVEEAEQPIEVNFDKDCNDFYFLLDVPASEQELESIINSNVRIDILVVIENRIKPGSLQPDFSLLNNKKSVNDLEHTLKNTEALKIQDEKEKIEKQKEIRKKIVEKFQTLRAKRNQVIKQGTIILQIPYMNDLSKPETDNEKFINSLYERLCQVTMNKKEYSEWKQTKKTIPMIQPMKQTITKEVQVQKNEEKGKKGGKSEPVFETVEEVVQTRYESLPQNIKSDLKDYERMKKVLKKTEKKCSIYNNIIDSCLQIFDDDQETNTAEIGQKIQCMFEAKPLNKVKQQNLVNRVRQISYPKNISLKHQLKFNFQPINSDISFLQLAHKADGNLESLKIQFLVGKMQQMIKKTLPKIKWDFGDRQNIQRFSAQRIISMINQQLLKDPEVISGYLESQGIKLLILTRTNPPGRVLYHNNMMDWKVLPDFQNWVDNFSGNQDMLEKDNFFDYDCSQCGNLAIKSKNMMPTDNTIIKDEVYTIGDKRDNLIQFYQQNCIFGMKKKNKQNIYWQKFENQINLKAFKRTQKAIKRTEKILKKEVIEGEKQEKNKETVQVVEEQVEIERTQVWIKYKQEYNVSFSPYPTLYWCNNKYENKRQFGSKGEITCYRKDGSIDIYYPDGSVSQFRNGKWVRIVGNQRICGEEKQSLNIEQIIEGEATIKIRQDQTVFVYEKNIKRIIFPDSTQLYENQKTKQRQIRNPCGSIIRIHLPRDYDYNVIGFGSAFAYLGFKNILQRSYDGYLFEFIDLQFSSHLYIEQFQIEEKQFTEEVRLLSFKDGSQIKILGQSGKIVYISPSKQQLNTQQHLNDRWLQLFTTSQNFGEGVYDIDIKNGCISTFDKESNRFNTKVGNPSVVKIAVSFSIDQSQKISENFPNGFHVPDQNYFLPPPNNNIPPRIFSINADGSGVQYLSANQIGSLHNFHIEEEYQGQREVRQYSRKKEQNKNYMNLSFTQDVNTKKFGLPERLRPQKTISNLVPNYFDTIEHRVIEKINWNSDFSRVKKIQAQIKEQIIEKVKKIGKLK